LGPDIVCASSAGSYFFQSSVEVFSSAQMAVGNIGVDIVLGSELFVDLLQVPVSEVPRSKEVFSLYFALIGDLLVEPLKIVIIFSLLGLRLVLLLTDVTVGAAEGTAGRALGSALHPDLLGLASWLQRTL
jgi:hypothetical protein